MNEDCGVNYIQPWPINGTVLGLHGVGVVEKSNHPDYQIGDLIYGTLDWPWKLYFVKHIDQLHQQQYSKVCSSSWGRRERGEGQ